MLDLSHLHDHKFKYNFQDSLNPICDYGTGIETALNYHLYYLNLPNKRLILKDNIQTINTNILDLGDSQRCFYFVIFLLIQKNKCILNTTVKYIISTKRFDFPLINS